MHLHDTQLVNVSLAVMGTIGWLWWAHKNKGGRWYAVAPVLYLGHVVLFYVVVAGGALTTYQLNLWSSVVRTQGLILWIGLAAINLMLKVRVGGGA